MRKARFAILTRAIYITIAVLAFIYLTPIPAGQVHIFSSRGRSQSAEADRKAIDVVRRDAANCQTSSTRFLELKEKYGLNNTFTYAKQLVHFTRTPGIQRRSMTKIPQKLFDNGFQLIDTTSQATMNHHGCTDPLDVPVSTSALPRHANASDFMFGISTTYERFTESSTTLLNDWTFWLTDGSGRSNGGKLILVLIDADQEKLASAKKLLAKAGINADTITANSSLPMATRYLSLVPTMYQHRDAAGKKWLVLCDDDTFFPNMNALQETLQEYDHTREMYIGALSEDALAVQRHGSQAFGGAGVFLSLPTAERITKLFDDCTAKDKLLKADWQGDRVLHQCIKANSDTVLTTLPGLWQLDTFGDASGFYEWGTKPLSLHHYRSWHKARPGMYAKMAHACGEDCTLQRFQTEDNYILSGYSVAHYPRGIAFDTHAIEATFRAEKDKGWNFDYRFGPQRGSLSGTGRKIAWELRDATVQEDGCVLQTYVRRGNDTRWVDGRGKAMEEGDGVIELVWGASGR